MNLKKIVMILCASMMLVGVIGCGKAFAFNLTVQKGEEYNSHMSTVQETVMIFNDQEMKTKQNMDMNISMNILDVDKEQNITISYTYDSMKMVVDSAGKKMAYDSTQDHSNNPLSSIYSGILGKQFTVKLDKQGKVLEVKGLDDIIISTIDNAPGTAEQKQALKDNLKQSFSDETIKMMIQQNMNNYPPQNIKVGESWENTANMNVLFPMSVTNKCKLLGEKDGLLMIEMQSAIHADTQNNAVDIMGVKANVLLDGEITGNINVNKKNPLLQYGRVTQNISGEMELETGKETPQIITLPMKITSTATFETIKK